MRRALKRHTYGFVLLAPLLAEAVYSPGFRSEEPIAFNQNIQLQLGTTRYLSNNSSEEVGSSIQNPSSVYGRAILDGRGEYLEGMADVEGMFTVNRFSRWYLNVRELYFGSSKRVSTNQVHFGRKLERWNALDDYWQLGLWQPRFRWDYISPKSVGLTGAFATVRLGSNFKFVAQASPVYLPEQGPPFEMVNGKCVPASVWFNCPPHQFPLAGGNSTLLYEIKPPAIRDIILNPGVTVHAQWGSEKRGAWGRLGYAYKPMNQALIGVKPQTDTTLQSVPTNVTIFPRIIYHQLVSAEAGYTGERVSGWVSALNELPIRDSTPSDWTTQEVSSAVVFSTALAWDVLGRGDYATSMDVGFIRLIGGNAPDKGDFSTGEGSNFESRYPYQSAFRVGLVTPLFTPRLRLANRVTHETSISGNIISSELIYRPTRSWRFTLGADVLSANGPASGPALANFIQVYRANDRVTGGVSYVF